MSKRTGKDHSKLMCLGMGMAANGDEVSFGGVENVLKLGCDDG